MTFQHPSIWALLLLALLPLLWWRRRAGRRDGAVAFSDVGALEAAGRTWAVRLRWFVPAVRMAALAILIVCVARPQRPNEHVRDTAQGIAIQLVIDRSGSMRAQDFVLDGRRATRLDVVKHVVEDFVSGGDDLPGRSSDLVGLITFGTNADALCPLTLDHSHLIEAVRQTRVSADSQDQATAIGDAIALAVERMSGLEKRRGLEADRRIRSKVMILLTDGEQTAGEIDPMTAARLAATFGMRIYTIGAGSRDGTVVVPDPIVGQRRMRVTIDEPTLQAVAATTGGRYFRATDSDALAQVYAQIDALERSDIDDRRYVDYAELAIEPVRLGGLSLPSPLAMVVILLVLEALLSCTRFRTLP